MPRRRQREPLNAPLIATERMAEEAKNKLLKVILDKVYRPDGTARPRDEVERLFRKKTDAARR